MKSAEGILCCATRRMVVLCSGILFAFLIIALRLFYLQIYEWDYLRERGIQNVLRHELVSPLRGNVVDYSGILLATNRPIFDLYWEGSGALRLTDRHCYYIDWLKQYFKDRVTAQALSGIPATERYSRRRCLVQNLAFDDICILSEQCADCPHLIIVQRYERTYPYERSACHLLGYLGRTNAQLIGRAGIEKLFDEALTGNAGYVKHITSATGKQIMQVETVPPQSGRTVHTTLDITLQQIAESLFSDEQSGAFVLMDPHDGAIRVLASCPRFDPNRFLESISEEEWQHINSANSPFINRAINACYPPASTFKLVTFAAAFEEHIIDQNTQFECNGYTLFSGRRYYCQRRWGHGSISCKDAFACSCNIPCYQIAQQLSIDQIADYAARFGLGQKTNFSLADSCGLVPTAAWKKKMRGEAWWPGETLSSCIGQSYLLVTPLQVARMIASIATGYIVKPRILSDDPVVTLPLDISERTRDFLIEGMQEVVETGTGKRLHLLKDFFIHAKTGTAQIERLKKKNSLIKNPEHAWFSCFFSYKGQPEQVLVVLVERAGSSRPALRIAQKFLEQYAHTLQVRQTTTILHENTLHNKA